MIYFIKKPLVFLTSVLGVISLVLLSPISEAKDLKGTQCKVDFSPSQIEVLTKSYRYGRPFGLEYTLPAIAWQESSAGEVLINVSDPSFGYYHALLSSAANREQIVSNSDLNKLAHALVKSIELSASFAIRELLFWKQVHGEGEWSKIWASYNAGYNYDSTAGKRYSESILQKINYLKDCHDFNRK
ncbi:MAG: hypothetical protein IBX55_00090 [Methyloprofundus sp.]|nr:hypothetical protein [Methyloprofundus sp.]